MINYKIYKAYNISLALSSYKVYDVYRGVCVMLKKTESITYRTDIAVKEALQKIASEKKWTISFLSEEIIREWLQEKHPELMAEE